MAVTVKVENYPGLTEVVIDLGLGCRPRSTTHEGIMRTLHNIPDVQVDNVGGLHAGEGIWGVNRLTNPRRPRNFTTEEVAKIKAAAEAIAERG